MISELLISAIMIVESGGNADKIGSHGEVGPLQIRQCVVDDVNRIYKTNFTIDQMRETQKAVTVMVCYLEYYCDPKKLGREPTAKDYALCWNRGPSFHEMGAVEVANNSYWRTVASHLHEQT